jgi:prepilin-type N-terminal cleavage/methylation domain-containing protein
MSLRNPVQRAFTLIELLVVIAIISLLMSILLPSVQRAREQGRQAKCISNLHQVGRAMHMYFNENSEWVPIEKRNAVTSDSWRSGMTPLHGFYYGGHPGRKEWWGYSRAPFRDMPNGRPLTKILYPEMPANDVGPDDPLYEIVRDTPAFFCPSDRGGIWNNNRDPDPDLRTLYSVAGSSYDINYHFAMNWGSWLHYNQDNGKKRSRWQQRTNAVLRKLAGYSTAYYIVLYEDPFDSAQWNRIPRRGWHKTLNKHSFLFLDGHSANVYTDTAKGSRGTGWMSLSGNSTGDSKAWWNNKDDPFYQWRNIEPLQGWQPVN